MTSSCIKIDAYDIGVLTMGPMSEETYYSTDNIIHPKAHTFGTI